MIRSVQKYILLLAFLGFLSCSGRPRPQMLAEKGSVEIQEDSSFQFYYVCLDPQDVLGNEQEVLQFFLQEIANQQVIPTGPFFIVYKPNQVPASSGEQTGGWAWELGVPTAEGTMVKPPLRLKRWPYMRYTAVRNLEILVRPEQICPSLEQYLQQKRLSCQGPIMVRLLERFQPDSLASRLVESELWLARARINSLAE